MSQKIGLLLVNLGTPQKPEVKYVKKYLKEFLSDRRVIEMPPILWQPILRGIILNTRPKRSTKAYRKIWNQEYNESPLRLITKQQADSLQEAIGNTIRVDYAMRYGTPSISEKLQKMQEQSYTHICVMALYPQYSATSTASVYDEVFRVLQKMRWQPTIRTSSPWYKDPLYISALAEQVTTHLKETNAIEKLIVSFHGIPKSYSEKGDPYYNHCIQTAERLREALNMSKDTLKLTFQSRSKPQKWLEPYTDITVKNMAKNGIKNIAVITPGFISDCLETLEEIDISLRETFLKYGGQKFTAIPCLNNTNSSINILLKRAKIELAGWI